MAKRGKPLQWVDIDGCAYGFRDPYSGGMVQKMWRIETDDPNFASKVGKRCDGQHKHVHIEGKLTAMTAFYPKPMCQRIARHWRNDLYP